MFIRMILNIIIDSDLIHWYIFSLCKKYSGSFGQYKDFFDTKNGKEKNNIFSNRFFLSNGSRSKAIKRTYGYFYYYISRHLLTSPIFI